jgi:hypothetical protein
MSELTAVARQAPAGLGAFLAWRQANPYENPYETSVIYDGQPVLGRRWDDDTEVPATKFGLAIIADGYAQWLEEVPAWVADTLSLFAEFLEEQREPPGCGGELITLEIPSTIICPGRRGEC